MIKDIIASGSFPPVIVLFGEEDLLLDDDAQRLFDAASKLDTAGMNCDKLDADGMNIEEVLTIARSYPMMSTHRVIWVKHAEKIAASKSKKSADVLLSYLKDPTPSTILMFTASLPTASGLTQAIAKSTTTAQRKIASLKAPFSQLLKHSPWVEYASLREPQVLSWLSSRAGSMGLTLGKDVVELMIARTGTSLRELLMELNKLRMYMGDRTEVALDDVHATFGSTREFNIFELQKAIGRGDSSKSITIVTRMLEVDRQEMLIISMLTRYFMQLFRLLDLRGSTDRTAMAKAAGLPPFAVGDALDAIDVLGPRRIELSLDVLRWAESTLKSSATPPLTVLQTTLSRIFEASPSR